MHRQVHRTDVVPELARRRSMSLVARSKKALILQLYASQISHVAEETRPQAVVRGVVKTIPEHRGSHSR
jgi:TolB-like protein